MGKRKFFVFSRLKNLLEKIELLPLHPALILLIISLIIFLRYFLEISLLSEIYTFHFRFYLLSHIFTSFYFAYLCGSLILILLTGENPLRIFRLTTLAFAIIIIPPIIDYFLGRNSMYSYINPKNSISYTWKNLLFNLKNDLIAGAGLKLEIWTVGILCGIYIFLKRGKILRALSGIIFEMMIFIIVSYSCLIILEIDPLLREILKGESGFTLKILHDSFTHLYSFYSALCLFLFSLRVMEKNFFYKFIHFTLIALILLIIKFKGEGLFAYSYIGTMDFLFFLSIFHALQKEGWESPFMSREIKVFLTLFSFIHLILIISSLPLIHILILTLPSLTLLFSLQIHKLTPLFYLFLLLSSAGIAALHLLK